VRTQHVHVEITRYWWHALVATLVVAVVPPGLGLWFGASGRIDSALFSMVIGVGGSVLAASLGSALWMRHSASNDIVFGDLMIWGFLRRLVMEKRVMESAKLLAGVERNPGLGSPATTYQLQTLQKLAAALETRDPYTHGHSRRVARLSCMIAKQMGLPKKRVQFIRTAAAVHDVGKLFIPAGAINKPGKLTDEEFEIVKQHAERGADMVARTGNDELTALVRHHHERVDGGGYPDGLRGPAIPLGARIIAVADTFDAITSSRSYRSAAKHKEALEILRQSVGSQLDPDAVSAFLSYYSGRRSLIRWATMFSGPRWVGQLMGWFQGAGASGVASSAAAAGTAAMVSASVLTGGAALAAASDRSPSAVEVARERTSAPLAEGLPLGLASKDELPAGLASKDELPPRLAKQLAGNKRPSHARSGRHASKPAGDKARGDDKRPSHARSGKHASKLAPGRDRQSESAPPPRSEPRAEPKFRHASKRAPGRDRQSESAPHPRSEPPAKRK
jgi:hypothetical protein